MKVYYQTRGYTCGPSSALMVLEHFGKVDQPSEDLELKIAKNCRFSEGNINSSLPNLASYLLKEGLQVDFYHEKYEKIMGQFVRGSSQFWRHKKMIEQYSQQEKEAFKLGLNIKEKNPTLEDISLDLKNGKKIMALVKMEEIPHCVVINSLGERGFEIFCPIRGIYFCQKEELLTEMKSVTGRVYLAVWK
jgi:hypothetical protein